jgi:hypothetical protein
MNPKPNKGILVDEWEVLYKYSSTVEIIFKISLASLSRLMYQEEREPELLTSCCPHYLETFYLMYSHVANITLHIPHSS